MLIPQHLGAPMLVLGAACWALCACNRMPPGDWTGRCDTSSEPKPGAGLPILRAPFGKSTTATRLDWVTDRSQLLDAKLKTELTRELSAFHAETCHRLAVVTVQSLEGQPIEAYSLALANDIGLGYPRFNNGLMLLVAPNDRSARIEVGCGLEDVVTDAAAAAIMAQKLVPAFRAGNYAAGIRDGMRELMTMARRKPIPNAYRPEGCR